MSIERHEQGTNRYDGFMIVIEASVMASALVADPASPDLLALLADEELHAPALLDADRSRWRCSAATCNRRLVTADVDVRDPALPQDRR